MFHRTPSKTTRAMLIALALVPLAGVAVAGSMDGERKHCRDGGRHHGEHRHGMKIGEHVDGKMAFLKAELAITPEQEDAWMAVENTLRAGIEQHAERAGEHRDRRARRKGEQADKADMPSVPDRLAHHVEAMEARLAQVKAMQGAVTDLYAVLSPEQQATADQLLSRRGKGMRFLR